MPVPEEKKRVELGINSTRHLLFVEIGD